MTQLRTCTDCGLEDQIDKLTRSPRIAHINGQKLFDCYGVVLCFGCAEDRSPGFVEAYGGDELANALGSGQLPRGAGKTALLPWTKERQVAK